MPKAPLIVGPISGSVVNSYVLWVQSPQGSDSDVGSKTLNITQPTPPGGLRAKIPQTSAASGGSVASITPPSYAEGTGTVHDDQLIVSARQKAELATAIAGSGGTGYSATASSDSSGTITGHAIVSGNQDVGLRGEMRLWIHSPGTELSNGARLEVRVSNVYYIKGIWNSPTSKWHVTGVTRVGGQTININKYFDGPSLDVSYEIEDDNWEPGSLIFSRCELDDVLFLLQQEEGPGTATATCWSDARAIMWFDEV